jgi:hypothetical protein
MSTGGFLERRAAILLQPAETLSFARTPWPFSHLIDLNAIDQQERLASAADRCIQTIGGESPQPI